MKLVHGGIVYSLYRLHLALIVHHLTLYYANQDVLKIAYNWAGWPYS